MVSPNNLPQQCSSFIGRQREIAEVKRLLAVARLVTLTGAGGCGKTRLALKTATDLLSRYPDGVWFVELAALTDPHLVPHAVARVLDIREEPGSTLATTFLTRLRDQRSLLVLDNCEHLLNTCGLLARDLLQHCTHLRVLATSRQKLGVDGEVPWRVPSLSLPDPHKPASPEGIARFEGVQLFVERARLKRPFIKLTSDNAPSVGKICHRLDGIPLAIELAAARVSVLSLEQIADKLDERFRLLISSAEETPQRQRTLRALLDWSYDLLSEEQQALLRAVSVFTGGFTLEAAQGISQVSDDEYVVIDLLSELVDKSLVIMQEEIALDPRPAPAQAATPLKVGESPRYTMLETIRAYAWMKAEQSGEMAILSERHAAWCLHLIERATPELYGPEQAPSLAQLERERDNIRTALHWACQPGSTETALRLVCILPTFWEMRGYLTEGRAWIQSAAALPGAYNHKSWLARALLGAGRLALDQGDYPQARRSYEESLSLQRELDNKPGVAAALENLGRIASSQGDTTQARILIEESMAIREVLGDRRGMAMSLNELGIIAFEAGDYRRAYSLHEQSARLFRALEDNRGLAYTLNRLALADVGSGDYASAHTLHAEGLALFEELGDRWGIAWTLLYLGEVARCEHDYVAAGALYEESLLVFREVGDKYGIAASLQNLGHIARHGGDFRLAASRFKEGLLTAREIGHKAVIAECIAGLAGLAGASGQGSQNLRHSARMFGAAHALLQAIGARLEAADQLEYERNLAEAKSQIDEVAWAQSWTQGEAMSQEQAITLALQPIIPPPHAIKPLTSAKPTPTSVCPDDLTEREVEVLRLVAAGLNNHEMAEQLNVSPHTVQAHVRSIYSKLGIASRSAATRYAISNNLT